MVIAWQRNPLYPRLKKTDLKKILLLAWVQDKPEIYARAHEWGGSETQLHTRSKPVPATLAHTMPLKRDLQRIASSGLMHSPSGRNAFDICVWFTAPERPQNGRKICVCIYIPEQLPGEGRQGGQGVSSYLSGSGSAAVLHLGEHPLWIATGGLCW